MSALLSSPAPDPTDGFDPAPGPHKPAGIPGKMIVIGVALGSLLITAGFWTVKLTRADPKVLNRATLSFTDGLGALERIARCREGIERLGAEGDDDGVIALQKRELHEWEVAETAFAESVSTGAARRAAVGWLAEVKRRDGDLSEAKRLFDRALSDRPPPQALNAASLIEEDATPDPADFGGRALVHHAEGNTAAAAADAREALALYDAGAKTRARNVYALFAPDRKELARLAGGGGG